MIPDTPRGAAPGEVDPPEPAVAEIGTDALVFLPLIKALTPTVSARRIRIARAMVPLPGLGRLRRAECFGEWAQEVSGRFGGITRM